MFLVDFSVNMPQNPLITRADTDLPHYYVADAGSIDELPLSEFESIDANFRNQWYGGEEAAAKVTDESKEADFWKAMESGQDAAEVLHGANLDTTKVGSGFPRLTKLGADR